MLRLLFDENFDARIVEGVRLALPDVDLLTVREARLRITPDPRLLAWAASEDRIVTTHDVQTMPGFAYDRVNASEYLPGVFVAPDQLPIGQAIDDLIPLIACAEAIEWVDLVLHLPLK
jgi:hypothetical protein